MRGPAEMGEERRARRLADLRQAQAGLRRRLLLMVAALVLLLLLIWGLTKLGRPPEADAPQPASRQVPEAVVELPPLNLEVLEAVRDATLEERVILEPEPYTYVLKMAQALVPDHLRAIGEPALPFGELEQRSAELRGRPFRLRGELLEMREVIRTPGAPAEHWARVRAEEGGDLFFAALRPLAEVYPERYVRADGYYFKTYSGAVEGERFTAPLLIGRQLVPSFRPMAPAAEVDFALLADVRDATFEEPAPLDERGLWHLLGVAVAAAADPMALDRAWAGAPELNLPLLQGLAESPALWRGRPLLLPGRVLEHTIRLDAGVENPLRLEAVTYSYMGNLSLGRQPVHIVAPGRFPLLAPSGAGGVRQFLGWFLQMEGYEDSEGNFRLAPVFVVGAVRDVEVEAPAWMNQFVAGLFVAAASFAALLAFLVWRDRRRSEALAQERAQRRKQMAAAPGQPRQP